MNAKRWAAGILFLAGAFAAANASAAELKVLAVDSLKPAMMELEKAFDASSKDKLKVEYASSADIEKKITAEDDYDLVITDKKMTDGFYKAAKVAGGSVKSVAKHGDQVYDISMTNWTQHPLPAQAVIDFLQSAKAKDVFKAKGMQG